MKTLLLSPPYVAEYMRNARCDYVSISHTQWYPIWLSYCGALLEKHDHNVELIDAPAENLTHEATMKKVNAFHPDLVVVYSSTKSQDNDIQFAETIKQENDCKVVFVGPFVSINPKEILEKSENIDFAVKGEFDYPVLELANEVKEERIRNLIYRENGKIIQNELRPLLTRKELDELPFVTDFYRRHLDLNNYQVPQQLHPFVDLFTGRGCVWGRCTFCLWVHSFIPGSVYNTRSINNVIEEMCSVTEKMKNVKEIFIQDDTLPKEHARELSKAIIDAGLDIPWSCYALANLDYDTLRQMKESGCRIVHVGYESASLTVLRNIKKGLTPKIMSKFTEDAKKAGLKIHGDFLLGLPGETVDSIKQTIKWSKQLNPDFAQFSLINLYEGTPLYDYLSENGYLKDGEPNYPHLSNEEIRKWAKKAVREFYISWRYAKRAIGNPKENLFPRVKSARAVIPRMFWKRW